MELSGNILWTYLILLLRIRLSSTISALMSFVFITLVMEALDLALAIIVNSPVTAADLEVVVAAVEDIMDIHNVS